MNKEIRIQKIQEIIDRDIKNPFGKLEIPWEDDLQTMEVYKIPLNFLVYNKYNGRILSRTKSLEAQKVTIDVEDEKDIKLIEKLLWESKPKKNKETLESLKNLGQEKVGIITKDGIIIDGNRRAMLLNKIDHIDYFKAVVLPITYADSSLEIEKFETKYQLGEERKLDYNPIEIYLKIQNLYKQISGETSYSKDSVNKDAIKKIYSWIGNYKTIEKEKDIEYFLKVMNTMDEYLDTFGYNSMYTTLDDREEQFRGLTSWLDSFYSGSNKAFDGYTDRDVDKLRDFCFDYIRIKFKNEKFRYIGQGHREKHFFGNKEIWESLLIKHNKILSTSNESEIDYNSSNLQAHLNSRDSDFRSLYGEKMNDNVDHHYSSLKNQQSQDEPEKQVTKALDAFTSINKSNRNFSSKPVQNKIKKLTTELLSSQAIVSPSNILTTIIDLLEKIEVDNIPENEIEDVLSKTKKIQQIGYRINKAL
jgi:hypothetical protein